MGCKMPWWAGSETPPPDKDKTIDDLRAEVDSLKEEDRNLTETCSELKLENMALVRKVDTITQQLVAANGRVEKYRGALQQVIVLDQPKYNYGNCADVARAALSDLPEADKEKS